MSSTSENFPKPYIAFAAYSFLLLAQFPLSYLIQNVSLSGGILLNQFLIVSGTALLIQYFSRTPFLSLFPFKGISARPLFWLILMTLALDVMIDHLTFFSEQILPPPPAIKALLKKIMGAQNTPEGLWKFFLLCITPAFSEEFFFRGFFQNTFRHHLGKKWALWITAAAFTLIHGIPWYWHLYFILGFYVSWLFLRSGNLWYPIFAHLINNSWTYLNNIFGAPSETKSLSSVDHLIFLISTGIFIYAALRFSNLFATRD